MMKTFYLAIVLLMMAGARQDASGQGGHSDIQFWYDEGRIEVNTEHEGVATGEFATSGFFQQFEANPGFASETDIGLGVNSGDLITYNVLDDLRFWDGASFAVPPDDVQIRVDNNAGPDTVVDNSSGEQFGSSVAPFVNVIDQAGGGGDFHSHVDFYLEPLPEAAPPTPPFGAYGLKLNLSTDAIGVADSEPFFVVFNFGLGAGEFGQAIDAFVALLSSPLLPGDFNGDGAVDAADYTVWRDNLGQPEDPAVLSGNGNGGTVDATDYQLWRDNYGVSSSSSASLTPTAAPEPETTVLALVACCAVWVSTCRRPIGN